MADADPAFVRAELIAQALAGDHEALGILVDAVPARLPRRTRRALRDRAIRRLASALLADDPALRTHRVARLIADAGFQLQTRRELHGRPFNDLAVATRCAIEAAIRAALGFDAGWPGLRQTINILWVMQPGADCDCRRERATTAASDTTSADPYRSRHAA